MTSRGVSVSARTGGGGDALMCSKYDCGHVERTHYTS